MPGKYLSGLRLSDGDLEFLIQTAAGDVGDKANLKRILREDEDFRRSFIADDNVFRRLMEDDRIFLKISPVLFFEILLRNAVGELSKRSYTLERSRSMRIPVFDAGELVDFLDDTPVVVYLAEMLSSFTRVESYAFTFRTRRGIWRKIRFNDMDINSLIRFSEALQGEHRLGIYKRIADICLFVLGIFPDFAEGNYRYPVSGEVRPELGGRDRISPEEYEHKGQQFYRLAAEHGAAAGSDLVGIFQALHENFMHAKKPLNFIAEFYLRTKRHSMFA